MSNKERLFEIFREQLEVAADIDIASLTFRSVSRWDSVGHLQLVAALEEEFSIMMDTDDVLDMSSVAKALEILEKYDIDMAA